MKARESGIPEEKTWEQFFNVEKILNETVYKSVNQPDFVLQSDVC